MSKKDRLRKNQAKTGTNIMGVGSHRQLSEQNQRSIDAGKYPTSGLAHYTQGHKGFSDPSLERGFNQDPRYDAAVRGRMPTLGPGQIATEGYKIARGLQALARNGGDPNLTAISEIARQGGDITAQEAVDVSGQVMSQLNGVDLITDNSFISPNVLMDDLQQAGLPMNEAQRLSGAQDNYPVLFEKLARTDYYPNIDDRILQGQFQSKTLGSVPIFAAPGAFVPAEVYQERKRAIERAAQKRRDERDEILLAAQAKGAVQYQDQIDDMTYKVLEDWGEKYEYNWRALKDDPKSWMQYQRDVKRVQDFAAETLRIDGIASQVYKDSLDPNRFVPASTRKKAIEWSSAAIDMDNMLNGDGQRQLSEIRTELDSYNNMVSTINGMAPVIQQNIEGIVLDKMGDPEFAQETQELYDIVSNTNDNTLIARALMQYLPEDRVTELASSIRNNGGTFVQTEEDFANYMGNLFGKQIDVKEIVLNKYNAAGRAAVYRAKPKTVTEGIFADKRNKFWNEETNTPNQQWTALVDSMVGQSPETVKDLFGQWGEVRINPNDPYLRAELQVNPPESGSVPISGRDPGLRFETYDPVSGELSWVSYDDALADWDKKYGHWQQAIDEINSSDDPATNKDKAVFKIDTSKEEQLEELTDKMLNGYSQGGKEYPGLTEKEWGEFAVYQQMLQGKDKFSTEARPTGGTLELQYQDRQKNWHLASAEKVSSGAVPSNSLVPFSVFTYTQTFDTFKEFASNMQTNAQGQPIINRIKTKAVDVTMPLMFVAYDMRGEGTQLLENTFKGPTSQQHRDDRGMGGTVITYGE
jgi:hypothetical protein